ncbi:hypothetical protein LINPERPRIM_LOCUS36890 [Linum perenne]
MSYGWLRSGLSLMC